VLVGLRYKLVLTAAQEQSCVRWEGICRAVWNTGLDQYRHAWRSNKARPKDAQVWPGFAVQCAELAAAKKQPGLDWLTDAPTHVLQQTLRDLDQAIRRHNPWRTHFRSQRRSAPSLRFPAGKAIVVEQLSGRWGRLKLPKLGAVKFRMPRPALSLLLSGVVIYAVLVLLGRYIGFTLDLSGIAGFIVAIGITADSFVVFFERLKDEVREGRSFRSAVPRGWVRARRTILTADAVSFLAAAVLYTLAVGQVQGFAFTLGMSTVLDLLVVFLVTHPLVVLASRSEFLSHPGRIGLGGVQQIAKQRRRNQPSEPSPG